ncbi:hypothetical protein [Flavihumibacter profundi]|uniref:hypothetical protein n=1 Tax=Flavihumibacter profundi TaxID=2716883 RepID=UPI001CC4002D|nr:hypothetical protein [Flavihumibacter profundi]MBZ5856657.1 hypothetical protein [Flavihumibacter profundi]
MNFKFSGLIAGAALVALSSCSSVYKSGQTPDDVYYSPGKPVMAVAQSDNSNRQTDTRNYEPSYRDDQYLRLMISAGHYPMYSSMYYYNDFAMVDPWMYNNWQWNSYMVWSFGFYSPWNPMFYWNSFYNPYYYPPMPMYPPYPGHVPGYGPHYNISRPASAFSMSSYLNMNGTNNNNGYKPGKYYGGNYNNSNYYNNTNTKRSLFGGNNNNSLYDRPTRSYSPTSNSGGGSIRSGSSGGSSGGGVSRPTRTGGN